MRPIRVTEDQILHFRARRGHLAGPGADSVADAARSILGAQSQQLNPSLLALSMRTKGRPTSSEIKDHLFAENRTLVRAWGQRDTLFVYHPKAHWDFVAAANRIWSPGGRGNIVPSDGALRKTLKSIESADRPVTRTDILKHIPKSLALALADESRRGKHGCQTPGGGKTDLVPFTCRIGLRCRKDRRRTKLCFSFKLVS